MLVEIYRDTLCIYKRDLCDTDRHLEFSNGEKPIFRRAPYGDEIEAVGVTGSLWNIYINNTWWIEFPPTSGDLYFLVCLVSQFDSPSPRVLVLSGREIGHLLSNRAGRIFSGNKFNSVLSGFEHLESIGFNLDLVRIWFNRDECRLFV